MPSVSLCTAQCHSVHSGCSLSLHDALWHFVSLHIALWHCLLLHALRINPRLSALLWAACCHYAELCVARCGLFRSMRSAPLGGTPDAARHSSTLHPSLSCFPRTPRCRRFDMLRSALARYGPLQDTLRRCSTLKGYGIYLHCSGLLGDTCHYSWDFVAIQKTSELSDALVHACIIPGAGEATSTSHIFGTLPDAPNGSGTLRAFQ